MKRVLILDAKSPNFFNFAYGLSSENFEIFAGSNSKTAAGFFSKFVDHRITIPGSGYLINYSRGKLKEREKLDVFLKYMRKAKEALNLDFILPLSESNLIPLSFHREDFGLENIVAPPKSLEVLHDKSMTYKKIKEINSDLIKVPESYQKNITKFPCVVKPTKGAGSQLSFLCQNKSGLKKALYLIGNKKRKHIIQEYIPSQDHFTLNIFVNRDHEIRRVLCSDLIPKKDLEVLLEELEDFFKKINYFGFVSPQFILHNENIYFMEINPRLSCSYFGIDFGLNFPKCLCNNMYDQDTKLEIEVLEKFPGPIRSSKIYLDDKKDPLPLAKFFILEAYRNLHNYSGGYNQILKKVK